SHSTSSPYTSPLSLHDALPILAGALSRTFPDRHGVRWRADHEPVRDAEHRLLPDHDEAQRLVEGRVGGKIGLEIGRGRERVHARSEEHTSELQSRFDIVCRLLL